MFTFLQGSLMKEDAVYKYSLEKSKARFVKIYRKGREICPESFNWLEVLHDDEPFWRETLHPALVWWVQNILLPAISSGDREQVAAELDVTGRFFAMTLWKRGAHVPKTVLRLDDRGELRFPGHERYLCFGSEHAGAAAQAELRDGVIQIELAGASHAIPFGELAGDAPILSSCVRGKRKVGAAKTEWHGADPVFRRFWDTDMRRLLTRQNLPQEAMPGLYEHLTLADVWYYEKALACIEEYWPEIYTEMANHLRVVILLDTRIVGGFTASYFPGAVFLSHRPEDLHWTIENLIHEFAHSRLYQLFELDPILLNEREEKFRSPWRDDLRHLNGVLHGTYVFSRVASWYEILAGKSDAPEVRERLHAVLAEIQDALGILHEHGRFTELGQALLEELTAHHAAISNRVQAHLCQGAVRA